ncbi:Rv1733c family protein [Streptomyces asoensis]|uniref:Rv1733c family protein n=1 Tax=Streptomyces asoensis TaxID=249586 RepID=UPI0033F55037
MSAQGSPYASGPPSGRGGAARGQAGSLSRASDRFERWFRRVLMAVLVVGLPLAAVGAGLASYEASMRTVRAQAAERHQVTARLTSKVRGDDWAKRPVRVRWTDADGTVRTGTALVRTGTPEGAAVRVWVTRAGTVTSAPVGPLNATTSGWLVGAMSALGVAAAVYAVREGGLVLLDRRRYAQWEAEWDVVEPRWSGRFRR